MSSISSDQLYGLLLVMVVVLAVVVLVDAGLLIVWAVRREAEISGQKPPLFAPRWSLVHVWIAGQLVVALLVGIMLVALLPGAMADALRGKPPMGGAAGAMPVGLTLAMLLVQDALLVAVPAFFILYLYRVPLREIGLPPLPQKRDWVLGLLAGIVLLGLGVGVEAGISWMLDHLLPSGQLKSMSQVSRQFSVENIIPRKEGAAPGIFLLMLAGISLGAGFGEEFFFRGFLYNCAKRRFGVLGGVLLSAFCFALVHGGPLMVLGIFPMGILLALMYERTGSLWVTIIMHALNNGVALVQTYLLPGR